MRHQKALTGIFAATFLMTACQSTNDISSDAPGTVGIDGTLFVDWTVAHISHDWKVSNYNLPDGHWKSDFDKYNVAPFSDGLNIKISSKTPSDGGWGWAAGEIQQAERTGFGEYHVIMKAAPGSGLATNFFSHTGPYFGDPQDQISIELLGRSPFQVGFGMIADGASSGQGYPVNFDTTRNFALYSYIWEPDRVAYYINGALVLEVSANEHAIPQTSGYIVANVFYGRIEEWVGPGDFVDGAKAAIPCMSFRPLENTSAPTCKEMFERDYLALLETE